MMRWAAGLLLMATVCGCASAPPSIEVTHVAPAARDREAEVAAFWRETARTAPVIASDFSKPDSAVAYREKWRKEMEEQAWRDAAWGRRDKRLTIR